MDLESIKNKIADGTGLPAELLSGESYEEIIVQAKTLIALKEPNPDNRGALMFGLHMVQEEIAKEHFLQALSGNTGEASGEIETQGGEDQGEAKKSSAEIFADWASNFL